MRVGALGPLIRGSGHRLVDRCTSGTGLAGSDAVEEHVRLTELVSGESGGVEAGRVEPVQLDAAVGVDVQPNGVSV